MAIFSDLESKKPEIEKEYGAPFTWDPEPNKRSSGCWIWVTVSETPFSSDQGNWEDVQNEMKFDVVGRIKAKGISAPVEVIQVRAI